jgi:DNA primase catalytic core
VVTASKNLWHCFGCQLGGGPIDWVMKMNGVSFRHAVELLREGITPLAATPIKQGTVRKLPPPVAPDADDQALLNQAVGYYHETLKAAPEALAYLKARGLDHPEAVERFKLGFANRTLGLRLPNSQRVAGALMRERLQRIGILRESGHEHFNGSLTIPVLDEAGNVTEVYGRKIRDDLRPGTSKHLYLPGPHRGVWNVEALAVHREIILTEALIDALTFWCAGYHNVTASYGVEGFTDDHLAAFKRYGTQRVLIAYDRDDAGERASSKLAPQLMAEGIECFRIEFPHRMDANEYALKVTPAAKSLGVVIRRAVWLGKGAAPARSSPAGPEPLAHDHAPAASSLAAKEKTNPPPAPAEPLPATPVPASAAETPCEVFEDKVLFTFADRRYRARGLKENTSYKILKVNLLVERGEAFYVDTVDLLLTRQRASYITQAAAELGVAEDVVKLDLARLYRALEELRDSRIEEAMKPQPVAAVAMAEAERQAALELLKSPDLISRILADLESCGLVGEKTNKLVAYLAATSRKLDSPLAVLVQSSSAAGKSTLMDAVLALMPEEDRVKYSAMTGQSLFYIGNGNLKHKILAIAEEEGASRAAYALKLLHSEGELTIASTGKDPATGNLVTQEYRVEGPTMIFTTTTAIDVDEELKNRCLVLAVDESRGQTQAIHQLQRERRSLEGLVRKARKKELLTLHQNAQRLLRLLEVLNPYAERLTFPDQATRARRDHEKYLTLIDVIALTHQHQREVKTATRDGQAIDYIEATLADIALANDLAHEVLGRSLDELPPQTRRLLQLVERHVGAECKRTSVARAAYRFSRRALREAIGWGDTQLKLHLARLVDLEYLVTHRAARGAHEYELLYDGGGEDGRAYVPGLIDVDALKHAYDLPRSGVNGERSGSGRGLVGPRSGGGREDKSAKTSNKLNTYVKSPSETAKTQYSGEEAPGPVVAIASARRA